MPPLIIIKNRDQAIVETNYFDTPHAKAGSIYLSWNTRAARLLVPDNQKGILSELRGAREVLISRGPWTCRLYPSPSPRDRTRSRMPSSA